MGKLKWIMPALIGTWIVNSAFANGFLIELQGGLAIADLGNSQSLYVNPEVENQYISSNQSTDNPFVGFGPAYHWDHIVSKLPNLALNLGLSAYYVHSDLQGVNTPGINQALPGVTFDTLNYTATQSSGALMVEPKLIYTAYAFQPYVVVGIGSAWAHASNYSEIANGTTVANLDPFNSKTTARFAYSIGAGLQHQLIHLPHGDALIAGVAYSYMSWSAIEMSSFPGENGNQAPNFGVLKTSLISANLSWQF